MSLPRTVTRRPGSPCGRQGQARRRHPADVPLYVVVAAEPAEGAEGDCGCNDQGAPRLPDQEDLVGNPGAYSQDIGLNCVNFTVPNRTLEEFAYTLAVPHLGAGHQGDDPQRPRPAAHQDPRAGTGRDSVARPTGHPRHTRSGGRGPRWQPARRRRHWRAGSGSHGSVQRDPRETCSERRWPSTPNSWSTTSCCRA